jgi:hypothetical protein
MADCKTAFACVVVVKDENFAEFKGDWDNFQPEDVSVEY